jgi:rare lipoprotein A
MWRGVVGWSFLLAALLTGCGAPRPVEIGERGPLTPLAQTGIASWYGPGFHGKHTSSGEIYDQDQLTAAHRTLPLGTRAEVTNLRNGRSVQVRINDRGPFVEDRILDLSYAAARALDMIGPGTAPVRVQALDTASTAFPAATYAVQAGSFADDANAQRLKRRLGRRLDEVYIAEVRSGDRFYYRVRVGPYERREDALQVARRLVPLGIAPVIMEEEPLHGRSR